MMEGAISNMSESAMLEQAVAKAGDHIMRKFSLNLEDATLIAREGLSKTRGGLQKETYTPSAGGKAAKAGCFIATACYGLDAPEVVVLRRFRDESLLTTALGGWLVETYYGISPRIARQLARRQNFASLIRVLFLDPLVAIVRRAQK